MQKLLPTTVVGSYPQPDWLVDREKLKSQTVPRVRVTDIWRVEESRLEAAQDDATVLAIRDMERAGIDITRPRLPRNALFGGEEVIGDGLRVADLWLADFCLCARTVRVD